jgi:hypothetical protein
MVWRIAMITGLHTSRITIKAWLLVVIIMLALNQLYKSISLEMKSKCIDKECETVATAVDIVEKHEVPPAVVS